MKTKIQIKSVLGSVLFEFERENNTIKDTLVKATEENANLRGANLRGADLYGADLRGANLRDADLRDADLRGADLRGANLRDADLRDADLRGANLRDADLRGANLRGADLYGANLYVANLYDADLYGADLRDADLYGADLYNANLWQLPTDYINQCSRDILSIFKYLSKEVPFLKEKLIKGEVNGSQYKGKCACLIGTLANGDGGLEKVCQAIPFYERGTQNYGEMWFLNILKGDTPENNQFSAHVLKLIEMHEKQEFYTITYKPTEDDLKKVEELRAKLLKDLK